MSESKYRQMVANLAADGNVNSRPRRDIAEEIVARVVVASDDGEQWAAEVLERWDREGAERDYKEAHGALNTTTYIAANGTRKRKSASYSLQKRSAESGAIVAVQTSIWDFGRPEFNSKRTELGAKHAELGESLEIFDLIGSAWDRHPQSKTAREAWEADGRDVGEVDISNIA